MGRLLACSLLLMALAAPAAAVPVTYNFVSGTATVTAETVNSLTPIVAATQLAMDGSFVTFDDATVDLTDFFFSLPQSPVISMVNPYGGFDEFRVELASLSPGTPFSTLNGQMVGPGQFTFTAGFIDIDGTYSAFDSTLTNPPAINQNVPFQDNSFVSGSISTDTLSFTMTEITFAILPGAAFGETEDLRVKGDITFFGVNPIPEPGTASLLGMGLLGMALRRRSTSR